MNCFIKKEKEKEKEKGGTKNREKRKFEGVKDGFIHCCFFK